MSNILSYAAYYIRSIFAGGNSGADIHSLDRLSPSPVSEYFDPPSSPVDDYADSRDPSLIIESSPPHSYKHDYRDETLSLNSRSSSPISEYFSPPSSPVGGYLDSLLDTTHGMNVLSPAQLGSLSPSPYHSPLPHHSPLPSQPLFPIALPSPLFSSLEGSPTLYSQDRPDPTQQDASLRSDFAFLSSPSSPPSPIPSPHLFDFAQSDSDSYSRSSMLSTNMFNFQTSTQPPAKSAVSDRASPPTLLTTEILSIGNDALSTYEAFRTEQGPSEEQPLLMEQKPFSSFSSQQLEKYFAAAVDAKNALRLRKSVVAVDIGDALEALVPKLTIYEQDKLVIGVALEEIDLIKEECLDRGLPLNFYALEFLRHILPSHDLSIMEKHRQLFSSVGHILDMKDEAQQAAEQFARDPYALTEHRLPHLWTSQR